MKKKTGLVGCLILAILMFAAYVQSSDQAVSALQREANTSAQEKSTPADTTATAEPSLIGEWTMITADTIPAGSLIVREDGTYTRGDNNASVTGPYVLDTSKSPYALDLCLGECGAPGSEWTTLFCIFRFHTADTLELRHSPTDKRYTEFTDKADENTIFYVLRKSEPTE